MNQILGRLKLVMVIALICYSEVSFAQQINQTDAAGAKHGLWKGIYEESKRPRYQGTFEHGNETGLFTYYDDTQAGTVLATREFDPKDKSAYTIFYNQKKNKVSEGKTINKLREGPWKYYHQDTKVIMTLEHYKNDKLDGIRTVYFADGKIAEQTSYRNGIMHGPYKKFTPKGIELESTTYKDGQIDGPAVFKGSDGNIVSAGNFVNGLKKGTWKFYEGGKLVKEEKYPLVKNFEKGKSK